MPTLLLRTTSALLALTIVGVSLSLFVGRFMPADVLTTATTTVTLTGNRYSPTDTLMLIDLNRHVRLSLRLPVEGVNQVTRIHWTGEQVLLQTSADNVVHMYHYNILTDTLNEFPTTYTDTETGEIFRWDGIYQWSILGNSLWDYNALNAGIYRIELGNNTLQRVTPLAEDALPPSSTGFMDNPFPSSSETQVAFADSHAIYIFDADGSNAQQYPNPIEGTAGTYNYWSTDGRYLYLTGFLDLPTAPMFFRVFDVTTGEVLPTTQDLQGNSFVPCSLDNEWLSYVNFENEGWLFNYQTRETINLSLNPELVGQSIEWLSWFNGCDWLLAPIENSTNLTSIGFQYQPLYIVSRDGQTVHLLGENAVLLSTLENDRFLIAESQGAESTIYEIYFDGAVHRTLLGHFPTAQNRLRPLADDLYRWLIQDEQYNNVSVFDIRSGVVETYFSDNERVEDSAYWRWE